MEANIYDNGREIPQGNKTLARKTALAAGILYLLTFVSIPIGFLYSAVLNDPNYIVGSGQDTAVIIGGILEIIVALAGIGTAGRRPGAKGSVPSGARGSRSSIHCASAVSQAGGTGPASVNVRRYQKASRRMSFPAVSERLATLGAGSSKGGFASDTSPGCATQPPS